VIAVTLVVVAACSLVIYNIFYISIIQKVKEYGQLRTIGATGRQIRRMVLREGRILSMQYIPIGLLMGSLVSYIIRPSVWLKTPSLILVLCAGLATFITVMLSVRKPAKIAASASPIEAVTYTSYRPARKRTKRTSKKLTPVSLGMMNLTRNKKKTVITFMSLVLSGVLLIVVASLLTSVDPVARAKQSFPYGGEYQIELNRDLLSPTTKYSDLQINNPLSNQLKEKILSIEGVDALETHKYIENEITATDMDDNAAYIENIREQDRGEFNSDLVEGALPDSTSGSSLILINRATSTYEYLGLHYKRGDKVNMILSDGKTRIQKNFIVAGMIDNKNNSTTFFLPDAAMDHLIAANCNLSYEIISKQGYSAGIESELRDLIASEERLDIVTLKDNISSFRSAFHTISIAVYAFVTVIACFGVVNLANTIMTNVISRKNEIGMMQAIGLSKKQLRKMLNTEHAYLTFGGFAISVFLGSILGYVLCQAVEDTAGFSFVVYRFPAGIIALYFLMAAAVQFTLTQLIGQFMTKQTVIERLRET
ncbi:MAG: ABC transporter permease, partial [Gorillibacterium sp.]|nr:ABC transporter permease [Gorillibacterium sp.]